MFKVLVLGAGQIGLPVAEILARDSNYEVHLGDTIPMVFDGQSNIQYHNMNVVEDLGLKLTELGSVDAILSCLPFKLNKHVADIAVKYNTNYFDLTEDVETTKYVEKIAKNDLSAFVPQCGLAPGYVSMAAKHVMNQFDSVDTVKMRVGALPTNPSNKLGYNLTWSTNGLINECGNPCRAIVDGKQVMLPPLSEMEQIVLDGVEYECFTTSGGLGSLGDSAGHLVKNMNYKTLRYPGHCELFKFLMFDMKMNENREMFTDMLEFAIPTTNDDVVIVYVSVEGTIDGKFTERHHIIKNYGMKKYVGKDVVESARKFTDMTAIQLTTAAGLCGVVDIVLSNPNKFHGFVRVEDIPLDTFLGNKFGSLYTQ